MPTFQELISIDPEKLSVTNQNFSDETIDQEYITTSYFEKVSFKNLSFYEITFKYCSFRRCSFKNCTFKNTLEDIFLESDLLFAYKVNFSECDFENCTFLNLHWIATGMYDLKFQNCNFSDISWKDVALIKCDLKNCNFSNLIVDNSMVTDSRLYETNWKTIFFIQSLFICLKIQDSLFVELKFNSISPLTIRNESNSYKIKNSKEFQQAIKIFEES